MALLPELTLAATAIGAVVAGGGALYQGAAARNQAEYQAQVAQNNQALAQREAKFATQAGDIEAQRQGMKTKAALGGELAAQGASGLDVGSGTPLDIRASTAKLGALDALTIRNNAERRAYSAEVAATGAGNEAALRRSQASTSSMASYIGAGSSLLGGATSFGEKWSNFKMRGQLE